jgi:hypothetical protein
MLVVDDEHRDRQRGDERLRPAAGQDVLALVDNGRIAHDGVPPLSSVHGAGKTLLPGFRGAVKTASSVVAGIATARAADQLSLTAPMRTRLRPLTRRPTSSHMRRIWRLLPLAEDEAQLIVVEPLDLGRLQLAVVEAESMVEQRQAAVV